MLRVSRDIVEQVRSARVADHLHGHLQAAIKLEHATLPPYLTALYSIKPGSNEEAARAIRSIVIDEMLHMTIAANVLNAIGGKPQINGRKFIPDYPGPLPMGIGDDLTVGLRPLSKDVLENTFMVIEEPEKPLRFGAQAKAGEPKYATIGEFYEAIIDKIEELGDCCFSGNGNSPQVVDARWFPAHELFAVSTAKDAKRALNLVIQQGEGTRTNPLDPGGGRAHYYRFAELLHGRRLVRDKKARNGYSYSGECIRLDAGGIWDLVENSKADMYEPGTRARRLANQFNFSYTSLLNVLHAAFNGQPSHIDRALGLMYSLRLQAQKMAEVVDAKSGKHVAPPFEYAAVNA